MVVGQSQVAHRADADGFVAISVTHHARLLGDCPQAQNSYFRLVDDGGVKQGATATSVGNGEGGAAQLLRVDLVAAGAGSEVVNTLSQPRNVQVASVLNHRNQQTTRGVYGNTDVLYRVVGNFLAVDRGVELGVSLERFGGSLHKERQEGQLSAVSSQEGVLGASTQRSDPGYVNFHHSGQLRRGLQRLDHAGGDDLTQAAHLLSLTAQGGVHSRLSGCRLCRCRGRRRRSRSLGSSLSGGFLSSLLSGDLGGLSFHIFLTDAATNPRTGDSA